MIEDRPGLTNLSCLPPPVLCQPSANSRATIFVRTGLDPRHLPPDLCTYTGRSTCVRGRRILARNRFTRAERRDAPPRRWPRAHSTSRTPVSPSPPRPGEGLMLLGRVGEANRKIRRSGRLCAAAMSRIRHRLERRRVGGAGERAFAAGAADRRGSVVGDEGACRRGGRPRAAKAIFVGARFLARRVDGHALLERLDDLDCGDVVDRGGERVLVEDDEVGELADFDRALARLLAILPGGIDRERLAARSSTSTRSSGPMTTPVFDFRVTADQIISIGSTGVTMKSLWLAKRSPWQARSSSG